MYLLQIAKEYHAKNYTDFAVVSQPAFSNAEVDSVPDDFFSSVSIILFYLIV